MILAIFCSLSSSLISFYFLSITFFLYSFLENNLDFPCFFRGFRNFKHHRSSPTALDDVQKRVCRCWQFWKVSRVPKIPDDTGDMCTTSQRPCPSFARAVIPFDVLPLIFQISLPCTIPKCHTSWRLYALNRCSREQCQEVGGLF